MAAVSRARESTGPLSSMDDVFEFFPQARIYLEHPGRKFVASEIVEGAKTPDFFVDRGKAKKRPYIIVVCSDRLLVGKQLKGLTRTNYRFKLFSLFASRVKPANQLEDGMYPIHLICTGDLSQKEPQKDPGCKGDARQRERLVTAVDDALQTLKTTLHRKQAYEQTDSKPSPTVANRKEPDVASTRPKKDNVRYQSAGAHGQRDHSTSSPKSVSRLPCNAGNTTNDSEVTSVVSPSSVTNGSESHSSPESTPFRYTGDASTKRASTKSSKTYEHPLKLDVSLLPSVPEPRNCETADDLHRHRTYCEMVETEKQFVQDMQILIKCFKYPLKRALDEGRTILSEEDIKTVFSNAETILEINGELLQTLCRDIADSTLRLSDSIAHAFTSLMPFFRMYTEYCQNYWNAMDIVRRENESNRAFQGFLKFCANNPETKSLDLESYLIKPVQRICKYPLFFKEILKHMASDHPCRKQLEKASAEVGRVANDVNTRIDQEEKTRRMVEIRTLLRHSVPDLLQPGRHFVLDKPEIYVSFPNTDDSSKNPRPYRLFVFTDSFIIGKRVYGSVRAKNPTGPNGPRYKVISNVDLSQILLRPGYGQKVDKKAVEKSRTLTKKESHDIMKSSNDGGLASANTSPTEDEKSRTDRHSTSVARYGASSMTSGNPGAGMGEGGSDLHLFDVLHKRPVKHKDGRITIAVDNIIFWFTTVRERDQVFETLRSTAEEWIDKKEALKERRESRGVGISGKKREFGKRKLGELTDLSSLEQRFHRISGNERPNASIRETADKDE